MNLLIATDHRFLRHGSRVYDRSNFDGAFFKDYQEVFESVSVICRAAAQEASPENAFTSGDHNVRFIALPDVNGALWALLGSRIAAPRVNKAVREADAVIIRVPGQIGWAAARFALRYGKPYMVEIVGDPREALNNLGNTPLHRLIALRYARRLRGLALKATAGSYVSTINLPSAYPLGKHAPYRCISSIRLAPEQLAQARQYRKNGDSALKVIMVANLVPYKRHQDLIRATRNVLDQGGRVEVHLAGDGPGRRTLERLTGDLRLWNHVNFHGHISDRNALFGLLDASDVFVLTSGSEGLPRAVIEAMARGLPVIASRAGGIPELVNEAELFPVGDVKRLAELIASVCKDATRLTRLSAENVEKAKAFTADKLSSKRVELYRFLKDKAGASSAATGVEQ